MLKKRSDLPNETSCPSYFCRAISAVVGAYPAKRGLTRLRNMTADWLVARLPFGAWIRVSGLVDAEWDFLGGKAKEDATTRFVRSFVKDGSTFVDVGSNVGYFTLLASSRGARVVAYEPTPKVFDRLQENVRLNAFSKATLINAAVAAKRDTLTLYQSADDPEANNLFGDGDRCIQVPAVTLDEDLATHGIERVDLLKIDAEGAEPLVLDGAARLLTSVPAPILVLELNPFTLRNAGFAPSDIYNRLSSYGYESTELERCSYKGEIVINLLATPPARPAVISRTN